MTTVFHASESKVKPPYHTWTVAKYHQMAEGAIQTDVPQATVSYQDKIAIMRGSQLMVILRPQAEESAFAAYEKQIPRFARNDRNGMIRDAHGLGDSNRTRKTRALARKRTCTTAGGHAKEMC